MTTDINEINEALKNLNDKKFILQFTTEKLYKELSTDQEKHIFYCGKFLKKSYIHDLMHTFLLEQLLKEKSIKTLNSEVLKSKYSNEYNRIIDYLLDHGHIIQVCGYISGKSSSKYRLVQKSDFKIRRIQNTDKILLKKYRNRIIALYNDSSDINNVDGQINRFVIKKLLDSFYHLSIDYNKAKKYVDGVDKEDVIKYEHLLYSIDSINSNDFRFAIDIYGRFHTNMTNLKSYIRDEFILLDGEKTKKIDITNSQPLFFLDVLNNGASQLDKYEYNRFKRLVLNGEIYEHFVKRYSKVKDRNDAKKLMYVVMFGKNKLSDIRNRIFQEEFPTIFDYIKDYKGRIGDYKLISHEMQRAESSLIFNIIVADIYKKYPNTVLFTVHDSIHIKESEYEKVSFIFEKHMNDYKERLDNYLMLNLSPKAS